MTRALVLASSSPRRRALLDDAGYTFTIALNQTLRGNDFGNFTVEVAGLTVSRVAAAVLAAPGFTG